jgi:signal transduction histidine kinase/DNA-binding NarL/FixJ family response regulator
MMIRRHSLRTRLALLFGLFSLALVLVLGFVFEQNAARRLQNARQAQLAQAAEQMAERLDRDMYERLRDVVLLASMDGIGSIMRAPATGRPRLDRLQQSFPNYAWVGLTDASGTVLAATGGLLEGQDASPRPWFKAAQSGPVTLDVHRALMLEPYLGTPNGDPVRLVDVAAPVIGPDNKVQGVVAAHLSWAWAGEVQRAVLRTIGNLHQAEILVLSKSGEVLLGPRDMVGKLFPTGAAGRPASSLHATFASETRDYLAAQAETHGYRTYTGLGWTVVAREPAAAAFAAIRELRLAMLAAGLVITLLFVGAGILIAASVAQPLEVLALAADRLLIDSTAEVPVLRSGYREVRTLAASLASGVNRLQAGKTELKVLNNTLELKVEERTRELSTAKNAAEAATRAKTDFLATMSHELRSPLASIIGFSDLLLEGGDLTEMQRRRLEHVQNAGSALTCVINDILDFSKIEAGRVDIVERPFRLDCFVDGCVSIMQQQAEAKGVALNLVLAGDLPRRVLSDEGRLRQVLLNLLNNAVKFTSAGQVLLTVTREGAADALRLRFVVRDTGIGIAPDRIGRLFQRFSQADSSIEREFGGTGLGLAISQRLVGLMGGEITVESEIGGGSTFSFSITCAEAGEVEDAPEPETRPVAHSLRILLAEDLVPNQEIATAILTKAGHHVDVVGDGVAAVAAVSRTTYDLVLMDVQMPRMDGMTATAEIRKLSGRAATIPIIAMTANVLPEQVQRCRRAGMDGHVGKPIARRELMAQLDAVWARIAATQPEGAASSPRADELPSAVALFQPEAHAELQELLGPEKVAQYTQDLLARMRTFEDPGLLADAEQLAFAAHKMVGLAGMLGFTALAESCRLLEAACESNGDLERGLDAVLLACAGTLKAVSAHDLAATDCAPLREAV